jgi:hypothetical protein
VHSRAVPRSRTLATALALTLTAIDVGVTTASSASAASSDYSTGYSLGQQAYEYGRPLLDTDRVFPTATSIDVSDTSGNGPVNQFNSFPKLSQNDAHAHR